MRKSTRCSTFTTLLSWLFFGPQTPLNTDFFGALVTFGWLNNFTNFSLSTLFDCLDQFLTTKIPWKRCLTFAIFSIQLTIFSDCSAFVANTRYSPLLWWNLKRAFLEFFFYFHLLANLAFSCRIRISLIFYNNNLLYCLLKTLIEKQRNVYFSIFPHWIRKLPSISDKYSPWKFHRIFP